MQIIGRALRFIFSIYALLVFIGTFFIVFPCFFVVFNWWSKETAPHVAHSISRFWGKLLLYCFLIRVRVKNRNYIDPAATYVFVSNHQSQLDIIISAIACRNTFRFLAKAELTKVPVIGYVIKRLYVPVERKSKTGRSRSVENLHKSISDRISVFIYPEGTRNKTNNPLLDFYDGAFRLAIETRTPLAILVIKNSRSLLDPRKTMDLSPGFIDCHWLPPLDVSAYTIDKVNLLKDAVKALILKELEK